MKVRFLLLLSFLAFSCSREVRMELPEGVSLWGGRIKDGSAMPYAAGFNADLRDNRSNQTAPLLLTSDGRYVWSDSPFIFKVQDGAVTFDSQVEVVKAGKTLADAYRAASAAHFPADGKLPPAEFYRCPQYNTWIELMYNQNQEGVLEYARGILANGLPAGIIMIDDTWQEDYGKWEFHPARFPDPKAMCDKLHAMGFKVMLWICPFVSMDQYQICRKINSFNGFLMSPDGSGPYPVRWWNGTSAVLDLSNPKTAEWFHGELARLTDTYGVDGFKFDAADFEYYPADAVAAGGSVPGWEQCSLFVQLAGEYPYNELRAGWRNAGKPIVQRLHDKAHSWEDLAKLIPEMMAESLMGFSFCCPDMVGGGSFETFLSGKTDQELIVRSAQVHALMPMMQFSLAPWRVLSKENYAAVLKAVALRQSFMPLIEDLYRKAAATGEPIVAPLEFHFPHQGLADVKDEFMLGESILVAPMLASGSSRTVILPSGNWKADDGQIYEGGEHNIDVPIDRLPYFEKL
jgi:alpha-glucosidase